MLNLKCFEYNFELTLIYIYCFFFKTYIFSGVVSEPEKRIKLFKLQTYYFTSTLIKYIKEL